MMQRPQPIPASEFYRLKGVHLSGGMHVNDDGVGFNYVMMMQLGTEEGDETAVNIVMPEAALGLLISRLQSEKAVLDVKRGQISGEADD